MERREGRGGLRASVPGESRGPDDETRERAERDRHHERDGVRRSEIVRLRNASIHAMVSMERSSRFEGTI
jgi:hypothetical protein